MKITFCHLTRTLDSKVMNVSAVLRIHKRKVSVYESFFAMRLVMHLYAGTSAIDINVLTRSRFIRYRSMWRANSFTSLYYLWQKSMGNFSILNIWEASSIHLSQIQLNCV